MAMKCTTVIDPSREEEVVIYAHEKSRLTREIEALIQAQTTELMGYCEGRIIKLRPENIYAVITEDGKVFAITDEGQLRLEYRLYTVEEMLGAAFVKINQSCLGNVSKIRRFDATIGGALMVTFQNGYTDYVSRRQLKTVKERIGFKR